MKAIINKIKKDKYYFLVGLLLVFLITLLFLFRENFISAVDVHLTSLKIFGNYYDLNLFDGIMFTSFIIITMVTAWYFGGHAAFMFVSISWNFEVALFIVLTGRYELVVEFVNILVFILLYFQESPADKKKRIQQQKTVEANIQLIKANRAFEKFVPQEFINLIGKDNVTDLLRGDSRQEKLTILFSDIRSFSKFAQNKCPKEVFDYLNSFLSEIGPVIRTHNGFIDKYMGDGIMALFPKCPSDALNCALEMTDVIKLFNDRNLAASLEVIKVGNGIHIGQSILGTIGEEERIETTVISEAVNLSSRLEELTKTYGVNTIVSQQLINELKQPHSYHFRYLDEVLIKGISAKCKVYELITDINSTESQLKIKHKEDFENGVNLLLSNNSREALDIFKELIKIMPEDYPLQYHINNCEHKILAV